VGCFKLNSGPKKGRNTGRGFFLTGVRICEKKRKKSTPNHRIKGKKKKFGKPQKKKQPREKSRKPRGGGTIIPKGWVGKILPKTESGQGCEGANQLKIRAKR